MNGFDRRFEFGPFDFAEVLRSPVAGIAFFDVGDDAAESLDERAEAGVGDGVAALSLHEDAIEGERPATATRDKREIAVGREHLHLVVELAPHIHDFR